MTFEKKREYLAKECRYGLENFCDGSPNFSMLENQYIKPKKPCPIYSTCALRKISIYARRGKK